MSNRGLGPEIELEVTGLVDVRKQGSLRYNGKSGRYSNGSVQRVLSNGNEGLLYGVRIPKGPETACTKLGANAGVASPVPSVVGAPGSDPYAGHGPFRFYEINGGVDPDGVPFTSRYRGQQGFSRHTADTLIQTPVLYWSYTDSGDSYELYVSDVELPGLEAQPGAYLPSGRRRPYMLYAKYPLVKGDGGTMSASGYAPRTFDVSYNSLIGITRSATTGYSGKSVADDWYVKVMFLIKYGTKNSQSVYTGCTSYNVDVAVSAATAGQKYVVVSNADAAKIVAGSTVSVGTRAGFKSDARSEGCTRDLADRVTITSITRHDDANMRLNLDVQSGFDAPTTTHVVTMPWHTGACDAVEGDGSPTAPRSGREPFVVQGIELGHGMYEVLQSVALSSNGADGWKVMVADDTALVRASDAATGFSEAGSYPGPAGECWNCGFFPVVMRGFLVQQGTGGSSSSGICDGNYKVADSVAGLREWLSLGALDYGGIAGLWCVSGNVGLGGARWYVGSRLSLTGRGGEAA